MAASILLMCLAFLFGAFDLANSKMLPPHAIARLSPSKKQTVILKGVVDSQPVVANDKAKFVFEVFKAIPDEHSYSVCGKVFVRYQGQGDFSYGDELIIQGGLYKAYPFFKNRSAYPILSVAGSGRIQKTGGQKLHFLKSLTLCLKHEIEKMISSSVEPVSAQLLQALILGEREKVPRVVKDSMIQTGTWHIMVVSGSHTALVALILLILLKVMRVPRRIRFLLTAGLLVIYCILTGASSSVVRATVMTTVFLLGFLIERRPHFYNSLAAAALVILIFDPMQLFDVGFQLSFASVFFIVWLSAKIKKFFPENFFQRRLVSYGINGFCISTSAWLGTAPLIAYVFGNFSPITVLANMIVVPLAMLVMTAGFALVGIGGVLPLFVSYLGLANEFLIFLLVKVNFILARIPFAFLRIPRIPLVAVFGYYFLIFLLFNLPKKTDAYGKN